ncbi:MAG: 3-keto-5-aminohexanoate cleavage protein [Gemmatales bacterium]
MKRDSRHVPITPKEIIAEARRCRSAGASILHIHARNDDESPAWEKEIYAEIIGGIRDACPDLIISASTSGRKYGAFEQRSDVLNLEDELKPDFGSLTLGSMNFATQPSINSPEMIRASAETMRDRGIVPELEIFYVGMLEYGHYLIKKGILVKPFYVNILLGSLGTLGASAENLVSVVRALPAGAVWAATGIGRSQFMVNNLAIAMGGHVRVGLEDSLYYDSAKTRLATNFGLIERLVNVARSMERDIASPDEARKIIGMPSRQVAQATWNQVNLGSMDFDSTDEEPSAEYQAQWQ